MNTIFSYGTLVEKFTCESERGELYDFLEMSEYGIYPALIKSEKKNKIIGKIISLTDKEFKQADYYEGYPKLYTREKKEIILDDGSNIDAWVYILNEERKVNGN